MASKTTTVSQAATESGAAVGVKPGVLFRTGSPVATFQQRLVHSEANLQFLDCAEYFLPAGSNLQLLSLPGRETLLFLWKGHLAVDTEEKVWQLVPYDTLYIPRGVGFGFRNESSVPASVIQTSAPARNAHPVFHSRFSEFSRREDRIRRLKGKNVYIMFGVSEAADSLIAGYTFFEPFARSWPPHNHTDQEEVYIFIKGHGSMEVYESPESLSFVHEVREGDIVSIPTLNYHPVFSQASPLEFIWCIAGKRYWVGDKNEDFLRGTGGPITT